MLENSKNNIIEKKQYLGRNDLIEFQIPDGIIEIEDWAFAQCESLCTVKLPSTVKKIGKHVFLDCPNLKDVMIERIPDAISRILAYLFTSFHVSGVFDISNMSAEQWIEEFDKNLFIYLNTPNDLGFSPFLAGGEEDYQDVNEAREEYETARRVKKCFMVIERLSLRNKFAIEKGCHILHDFLMQEKDAVLQVLLMESEKPVVYYRLLEEEKIFADDDKRKLLALLDERHVELKAAVLTAQADMDYQWDNFQL